MESFSDKLRAGLYALLIHLACIAVMFVGLLWTRTTRPVSLAGPIIQAELVGFTQAPKSRSSAKKPTPAKPVVTETPPPPAEEQKREAQAAEQQRQELQEREKVAALAQQKAEQAKREQDERKHQEQVALEEKLHEEQERKDRELQRKLEQTKAEREKAEKKRKLEQEKLAQLQDQQKREQKKPDQEHQKDVTEAPTRQTGTNGQDNSLLARYISSIQTAVTQNWNRPDSAQAGLKCAIHVVQIPGGEVIAAHVALPCNADAITRSSIEQAVMKAQPLPYQGYEQVFARDITFYFTYDG